MTRSGLLKCNSKLFYVSVNVDDLNYYQYKTFKQRLLLCKCILLIWVSLFYILLQKRQDFSTANWQQYKIDAKSKVILWLIELFCKITFATIQKLFWTIENNNTYITCIQCILSTNESDNMIKHSDNSVRKLYSVIGFFNTCVFCLW